MTRWIVGVVRSPITIAAGGGLLAGGLIIAAAGHNPLQAYLELLRGAFAGTNFASTLTRSIPLVGMALCIAVSLRAGLLNLGGEGQLVMGGLASALTALHLPGPNGLAIVVALLAGVAAGAMWALLPALLANHLAVPVLISSLLLNFPARSFASYLVTHPLRDVNSGLNQTKMISSDRRLPQFPIGNGVSVGLVIMAVVAIAVILVSTRTAAGYEQRLTGLSARFVRYGGVSDRRLTMHVLATSGALAGLVGALIVTGNQFRFIDNALISPQYTWTGLLAALLVNGSPLASVIAAFSFGALQIGGFGMERVTQIPRELTLVIQAVIIVTLTAQHGLTRRHRRLS